LIAFGFVAVSMKPAALVGSNAGALWPHKRFILAVLGQGVEASVEA